VPRADPLPSGILYISRIRAEGEEEAKKKKTKPEGKACFLLHDQPGHGHSQIFRNLSLMIIRGECIRESYGESVTSANFPGLL
jgi:hypothetical protein